MVGFVSFQASLFHPLGYNYSDGINRHSLTDHAILDL